MRCKNCGWENPEGLDKCEKCHNTLNDCSHDHQSTTPSSDRMKSTVAENVVFPNAGAAFVPATCPKCGYPVSNGSSSCPNCNYELKPAPTTQQVQTCKNCGSDIPSNAKFCPTCGNPTITDVPQSQHFKQSPMGTVMGGPSGGPGFSTRFCTLRPVSWPGEDVRHNPITYSGDLIILNRSNTDANNNSITSREQAVLTFEDGVWYIENRSDLRSTYLRVDGKVKLTNGDIIVLGNREFEFKG